MQQIFQKNGITWIKINQPSPEDIEYVKTAFRFHPIVIKSIVSPTFHPAIESYKDHLFLILHFPIIYQNQKTNVAVEIDFLITKKLLITITYKNHPVLDEFFNEISRDKKLQRQFINNHTGKLVYGIIDGLMSSLINDLDFLEQEVTRIEDKIFEGQHATIVEEISQARRDILDFKRIASPLQTVLKLLPDIAAKFYDKEIKPYFTDLLTAESKIRHLIENHKETIESLNSTNESLLSNKVSKIITLLTIFSAVILPLNFLASIWGMNHRFLPFRDGPNDFWIVAGVMAVIAFILILIFRRQKWL